MECSVSDLNFSEYSGDVLGDAYEYLIGQFASESGKKAGEFYTPHQVSDLMARIVIQGKEDKKGFTVYDPTMGAGGMFVQSAKFVESHQGRVNDLSIFGQEANANTWKLAQMNLAIHGLEGDLGQGAADTFFSDQHPSMRADFILANPPFN